ncbi:MAG: Hopene-associated glycosyltransferase HpnB [Betaproteobacteria bacterium]|nr:Hopene-associated glycosyltransferase HpnB [Betaproteobacteria bacterium]
MTLVFAAVSCGIWIYLLVGRGGFWRCSESLDAASDATAGPRTWPSIVAIVPARDEAEVIAASVTSLLRQSYPGEFSIVVVDDHSSDGTADFAREAARLQGGHSRVTVVSAPLLPPGWTGKLWALKHGIAHVEANEAIPDFFWLSDADITYADDALLQLAAKARAGNLALTSVMAGLRCDSLVERAAIPAFVFFFQLLYPFSRVNDRTSKIAAAAGGCMLVRRVALEKAGGIDAIRAELIDDCALARRLKRQGPIWLGFSGRVTSLRPYRSFNEVRQMVSRTAYCQLGYSVSLLGLTVIALTVTFVAPVVLALFSNGTARVLGLASWGLMIVAFQPTLRLYRVSPAWGVVLPAIALLYLCFTVDSAVQHGRSRGGVWKGRAQAMQPMLDD